MTTAAVVNFLAGCLLAPLLLGVIVRVKAWFAGRNGPPLLQLYADLAKLLRKGAVISTSTTWVFRLGPTVGLAAALLALAVVPLRGAPALLSFPGDLVLFAALFALMRFATVLAALDTASAFEGMGASREVQFAALAEPALLLGLAVVARLTGELSLSTMLPGSLLIRPELLLVATALAIVLLCENARIPFDDPNTHLELTMIHEVMVLDHSGPDFAFIQYGAALKLWALAALVVGLVLPLNAADPWWLNTLAAIGGIVLLAMAVGVVESTRARLRLVRVPQLLVAAGALAALALVLVLR